MTARLTKKQEAFAVTYIQTGNATEAYRNAYTPKKMASKTINEAASRLLKDSKISARIDELRAPALKATGLTVERTLREVERISHVDPRSFYRDDGTMKAPKEWDDAMAAAVASVEAIPVSLGRDAKGDVKIGYTYKLKFWDKNAGLEKSMKHQGLFERDNAQSRDNLVLHVEEAKPVKR